MKLQILASGSGGNCTVVTSADGRSAMIDIGICLKDLKARMAASSCDMGSVEALMITHEHTDHCAHISTLLNANGGIRCYATEGTAAGVEEYLRHSRKSCKAGSIQWDIFEAGQSFEAAGMAVESFSVSHDSADPVGFAVCNGGCRIAIATDMGVALSPVVRRLRDCDALVLESNHDPEMLRDSSRPWSIKQRIAGRQGHLSNEQSLELLRAVAGPRLKAVYLAHISRECNSARRAEALARAALREIGREDVAVRIARQDEPSEPFEMLP